MQRPKIVLGLGNPGRRYASTRHNVGFRVLDRLAARQGAVFTVDREGGASWIAELSQPWSLVLAKPRTYMNRSGDAAGALCERFGACSGELLVVYDDVDLPLGRLRIRPNGAAGGHNGIRSVIERLATEEIPRIRLGVRGWTMGETDLAEYVLAPFDEGEEKLAEEITELAVEALDAILTDGLTMAMNRYNARSIRPVGPEDDTDEEG